MSGEGGQHLKLRGRERNAGPIPRHRLRAEVDHDVAERDHSGHVGLGTSHDGPEPREEFADREGLGEIIVGAEVERLHAVVFRPAGRDDDHGHAIRLAEFRQQANAIQARQHQVEDDGVERLAPGDLQARDTVGRLEDGVLRFT